MGLDFVVLERENDDGEANWPGHELDARRADDPDPLVQAELRSIYDSNYSPAAMAASAAFRNWTPAPGLDSFLGVLLYPVRLLLAWPICLLRDWRAKQRDARRVVPDFETWRAEQVSQHPPPVVLGFGPNCPPGGKPDPAAVVQWYGFRGKVIEPENNVLVRWWADRQTVDLLTILYGEGFEDGPRSDKTFEDLELEDQTIGDMAALFAAMLADCEAAFPDIVEAADAAPWTEAEFGPFPDRELMEAASPVDLTCIRGAARFFAFWQGRGYKIAPDF